MGEGTNVTLSQANLTGGTSEADRLAQAAVREALRKVLVGFGQDLWRIRLRLGSQTSCPLFACKLFVSTERTGCPRSQAPPTLDQPWQANSPPCCSSEPASSSQRRAASRCRGSIAPATMRKAA